MLHLLDEAGSQAVPAVCAHLKASADAQAGSRAVLFGGPCLRRTAQAGGLVPDAVMAPPLGKPWLAPVAARQQVAAFAPTDLTAWSADSLLFARLFFPKVPATLALLQAPSPGEARLLGRLHRFRPFAVRAHGAVAAAVRQALGTAVPVADLSPCEPALPAPPTPATASGLIALVGLHADAWRGLNTASIFDLLHGAPPTAAPKHRLMVHPCQAALAHAKRQARNFGQPDRLCVTQATLTPWALPAGIPILALDSARGLDATQVVALPALARQGRPIVAEDTPALRALLEGAPGVRFATAGDAPALAHALTQVA